MTIAFNGVEQYLQLTQNSQIQKRKVNENNIFRTFQTNIQYLKALMVQRQKRIFLIKHL